jgi:hypothetical protein
MNSSEKLQLQKMITENNVEDQTELIRQLKHSVVLREDVNNLLLIKSKFTDPDEINLEGMVTCNFLFTYYTDIYNKIRKDEIDYTILFQFLDVLKKVEDGAVDQHEASFEVGTLLKKLYVDSALRKADKLNEKYDNERKAQEDLEPVKEYVDISWKSYKSTFKKSGAKNHF